MCRLSLHYGHGGRRAPDQGLAPGGQTELTCSFRNTQDVLLSPRHSAAELVTSSLPPLHTAPCPQPSGRPPHLDTTRVRYPTLSPSAQEPLPPSGLPPALTPCACGHRPPGALCSVQSPLSRGEGSQRAGLSVLFASAGSRVSPSPFLEFSLS